MSGTKLDVQIDVIKDPDIVEASESTIEDPNPVLLDDNDSRKKAYIEHNLLEPGAFTQIREQEVIAFILKSIICHFGIPKEISCDNGPQFIGKKMTEFFKKWHIKRILSTPYHPAGNGQAEFSNKIILNILKKKLEDAKGLWPELLPEVLWAYRTMPKTSTGETPYSLVYGTDVVIIVEVGEPSLRYSNESGPKIEYKTWTR
uniref:Uncharacterized protein LOC104239435 n=1 Tax=Nicotiana sylvestris TaxID=4096 RepID=A0A1U7Y0Q9_NICSY|nr:PREDICTED: uncharacterized protein LOC104239435 [Nicotiana sylvestris]